MDGFPLSWAYRTQAWIPTPAGYSITRQSCLWKQNGLQRRHTGVAGHSFDRPPPKKSDLANHHQVLGGEV